MFRVGSARRRLTTTLVRTGSTRRRRR
ncbi:hypothetical protein LINPERPRIM_LOCUS9968 [Linum perenne]